MDWHEYINSRDPLDEMPLPVGPLWIPLIKGQQYVLPQLWIVPKEARKFMLHGPYKIGVITMMGE